MGTRTTAPKGARTAGRHGGGSRMTALPAPDEPGVGRVSRRAFMGAAGAAGGFALALGWPAAGAAVETRGQLRQVGVVGVVGEHRGAVLQSRQCLVDAAEP